MNELIILSFKRSTTWYSKTPTIDTGVGIVGIKFVFQRTIIYMFCDRDGQ